MSLQADCKTEEEKEEQQQLEGLLDLGVSLQVKKAKNDNNNGGENEQKSGKTTPGSHFSFRKFSCPRKTPINIIKFSSLACCRLTMALSSFASVDLVPLFTTLARSHRQKYNYYHASLLFPSTSRENKGNDILQIYLSLYLENIKGKCPLL